MMNTAGREGISGGSGKVWLRKAAVSICPPASTEKQLTVNGCVCRNNTQRLLYIGGLSPCAILSRVHRCHTLVLTSNKHCSLIIIPPWGLCYFFLSFFLHMSSVLPLLPQTVVTRRKMTLLYFLHLAFVLLSLAVTLS